MPARPRVQYMCCATRSGLAGRDRCTLRPRAVTRSVRVMSSHVGTCGTYRPLSEVARFEENVVAPGHVVNRPKAAGRASSRRTLGSRAVGCCPLLPLELLRRVGVGICSSVNLSPHFIRIKITARSGWPPLFTSGNGNRAIKWCPRERQQPGRSESLVSPTSPRQGHSKVTTAPRRGPTLDQGAFAACLFGWHRVPTARPSAIGGGRGR